MEETKSKYEYYKPILTELVAFVKRPGIYVGRENMDNILAFIGGVELSTKFKLRFSNDLINHIFQKYPDNNELQDLKKNLTFFTLKAMTEKLSKSTDQNAIQIFKSEAIDLLVHISDVELSGYYFLTLKSHLKNALVRNMDSKDEEFSESFQSSQEDQIFRFLKEWPGKSLEAAEMELLESIVRVNRNRKKRWMERRAGGIDDKSDLRELSKELLVRMTLVGR